MAERKSADIPSRIIAIAPKSNESITVGNEEFWGPEIQITPTRRIKVIGNRFDEFTRDHENGLILINGEAHFTSAYELDKNEGLYVLGVTIIGRFPVRKDLVCRIKLPNLNLTLEGKFELRDEDENNEEVNSRHLAYTEDWKIAETGKRVYFFVPPDSTLLNALQFSLVRKHRSNTSLN